VSFEVSMIKCDATEVHSRHSGSCNKFYLNFSHDRQDNVPKTNSTSYTPAGVCSAFTDETLWPVLYVVEPLVWETKTSNDPCRRKTWDKAIINSRGIQRRLLVARYLKASFTVTDTHVASQPAEVRGGREGKR
jgi:hypothetical protein